MEKMLLQAFIAVGGAGLIIKLLLANTSKAVQMALDHALANPKCHAVLIAYRPQIEAFFDAIDQATKDGLDKAAQADAAKPTQEPPKA